VGAEREHQREPVDGQQHPDKLHNPKPNGYPQVRGGKGGGAKP
jgi:hypothetical protein